MKGRVESLGSLKSWFGGLEECKWWWWVLPVGRKCGRGGGSCVGGECYGRIIVVELY